MVEKPVERPTISMREEIKDVELTPEESHSFAQRDVVSVSSIVINSRPEFSNMLLVGRDANNIIRAVVFDKTPLDCPGLSQEGLALLATLFEKATEEDSNIGFENDTINRSLAKQTTKGSVDILLKNIWISAHKNKISRV